MGIGTQGAALGCRLLALQARRQRGLSAFIATLLVMWRRSGVMTDLEFYEIRYGGRAAGAVRGFRAVYLGLLYNCFIMASVNLAGTASAGTLTALLRTISRG